MRHFDQDTRVLAYQGAGGRCERCGTRLDPANFHADHKIPFARGGQTTISNVAALCPDCNLRKGDTMDLHNYYTIANRTWQKEALNKAFNAYATGEQRFVIAAAPGAGKTRAATATAKAMLDAGLIEQVFVIAPRTKVKNQWIDSLNQADIPTHDGTVVSKQRRKFLPVTNMVMTYQAMALSAAKLRASILKHPTLVIFDEIHHAAASRSWGESAVHAFDDAKHMMKLTGTPFRSDDGRIVWMDYVEDDTESTVLLHEELSYIVSYAQSIEAGYCRAIAFTRWDIDEPIVYMDEDGESETIGSLSEMGAKARKAVLSDLLCWDGVMPENPVYLKALEGFLSKADDELTRQRKQDPNAGGLIIAATKRHAELIQTVLDAISGEKPVLVHSGLPDAEDRIDAFDAGTSRWLVSVNMVSEGTDIPRLRVLGWLTRVTSELYFRQAMGRIVRKRSGMEDMADATCLIMAAEPWTSMAKTVEDEIGYVLQKRRSVKGPTDPTDPKDPKDPIDPTDPTDPTDPPAPRIITALKRDGGMYRGNNLTEDELREGIRLRKEAIANARSLKEAMFFAGVSPHQYYIMEYRVRASEKT